MSITGTRRDRLQAAWEGERACGGGQWICHVKAGHRATVCPSASPKASMLTFGTGPDSVRRQSAARALCLEPLRQDGGQDYKALSAAAGPRRPDWAGRCAPSSCPPRVRRTYWTHRRSCKARRDRLPGESSHGRPGRNSWQKTTAWAGAGMGDRHTCDEAHMYVEGFASHTQT